MKTKCKNKLRYIAAGIFMMGLVANVSLSLTDPFVFVGTDLLAQTNSGSSSGAGNQPCTTSVSLVVTEYGFFCSSTNVHKATKGTYTASCNPGDFGACEDGSGAWSATYDNQSCNKKTETFPPLTITFCAV